MNVVLRYSVFLLLLHFVTCAVFPVEKCNLEDSKCMLPAFQKAFPIFMSGMPEYGVEVLDVMEMDDFSFDLSGLKFSLKEGKLKGMKTAVVDNVKWNLKKKSIDVEYHLNCTTKGHYTANGRLLILPITGDGQMKLKLRNLLIKSHIDYEMEKGADGKDHVVPKKYSTKFEVRDGAHFSLTNLFNGNKELSDPILKFLNENWKQVSIEFGEPMIDAAAKKIFKNVVTLLGNVSIGDMANM